MQNLHRFSKFCIFLDIFCDTSFETFPRYTARRLCKVVNWKDCVLIRDQKSWSDGSGNGWGLQIHNMYVFLSRVFLEDKKLLKTNKILVILNIYRISMSTTVQSQSALGLVSRRQTVRILYGNHSLNFRHLHNLRAI